MHIRQATLADLDDLAPLFDGYRTFYGQPADDSLARTFLHERIANGQSIVLLAFTGDRAVGFVQLYPSFSSARAARTFILNDLFVAPEARGQGIARALLTAAAEHARASGAVRLTLATAHDNRPAQALYESTGWTRETTFVSYNLAVD